MKREKIYREESWLLVIFALMLLTSLGLEKTFGLFFSALIQEFGWPRGVTALAYSIFAITYSISTILSGWLSDRYSTSKLIAFGAVVAAVGFGLASLTSQVWHLYVTFGVMVGIGTGTFWVPSLVVITKSFDKSPNLRVAVGIVTSGVGFGIILLPPLAAIFIKNFGWEMAFLLEAFLVAFMAAPAVLVMRPRPYERRVIAETPREQRASTIFRTNTYWLIFAGNLFAGIAQATFIVHLPAFAVEKGISLVATSVGIGLSGVGTILGRIIIGPFERVKPEKLLCYTFILQAVCMALLIKIDGEVVLYAFCLIWGLLWGARVFAVPVLLRNYYGLLAFGAIYSVIDASTTLGQSVGPPIVGYLRDVQGSYLFGFLFTSLFLLIGSLAVFLAARTRAKKPA